MIPETLWYLIAAQLVMGLFDTVYHHELTERIAWRPSQRGELRLHGARNGLYAVLFTALAWSEPGGLLAHAIIALLLVELIITLADFVEEDRSRKLPASERIAHALLAINYGAILVLLLPVLFEWAARPTALTPAGHGFWSGLLSIAAIGTALLCLRDMAAARRVGRLPPAGVEGLIPVTARPWTILVTGATGFIGRRLVAALQASGHRVIALVRDPAKGQALPTPITLVTDLDQIGDEAAIDGIVNLAGEPIADYWWTAAKRRRILASRVETTAAVVALAARLATPPAVLVSGSAIGWYGLRQHRRLDETSGTKPCFSHEVCRAWEAAALEAKPLGVRVVLLRIGLVLGLEGGILNRMLTPFEFGLGGRFGAGRQWMSWIDADDLVRLIGHALARPCVKGRLNATAPEPVTNAAFTRALARHLRRPAWFPVPAALLHYLGGALADELFLGGQHVSPLNAAATGFSFRHPTLDRALNHLLGTKRPPCQPPRRV